MKLRYILTGLLVLAVLIFLSLLMISEDGGLAQAMVSLDQQTMPQVGLHLPTAITNVSRPNFVYLPLVIEKGVVTSPDNINPQSLFFDIELQATPTEVDSWSDMEYIIRYTVNNEAANNVVITSSIPIIAQDCDGNDIPGLYMYSDPPGTYSFGDQQIIWNLGTVAEGTTSEVKFAVRMPSDPLDGTTFTNQAFIRGDGAAAASQIMTVTLNTFAENSLFTGPPSYVRPGDTFCVPIDFFNHGTSHDTNLVLTHHHDPGVTTFISATMPYTYQGNQVTWQKSCVPRGTLAFTNPTYAPSLSYVKRYKTQFQAASSPTLTVGDVITNYFTYDTDLLPSGSQDRNQIVDLGPHAGYNGISEHIFASTRVRFFLDFGDDTSWPLDDLDLYVRLPLSTTFVGLVENGDFRCVPPTVTAEVSSDPALSTPPPLTSPTWLPYIVEQVEPGQPDPHPAPGTTWVHIMAGPIDWSRRFTLIVDYTGLSGGTVITTTGSYTSNQTNGPVAIPFIIPAFELDKYGPEAASATEDINYTLRVKNVSGVTSAGVVVTDTLPVETTFVASNNNGSYNPATHQVTWNLGSMASGQEEDLNLTVNIKRGLLDKTSILNQAELNFAGYSGTPIQRSLTTLVRSYPFFQVTHQPEKRFVPSGSLITYTITYSNDGTGASNDALVTSLLPSKTVFVTATTPNGEQLSYDGARIRWARPISVPVDVPQMVQLVVRNAPPSPDGTIITNVVFISSSQSLPAIGNLTTVTVGLEPTPSPTIPTSVTPVSTAPPGDDDDDQPRETPPSTRTPSPLPSAESSPTPALPRYLPETGRLDSNHSQLLGASLVIGMLILIGLWVRCRRS